MMAVFESATDAIACAVTMQHAAAHRAAGPRRQADIRIGLSVGEATSRTATASASRSSRRAGCAPLRRRPDPGDRPAAGRRGQRVPIGWSRSGELDAQGPSRPDALQVVGVRRRHRACGWPSPTTRGCCVRESPGRWNGRASTLSCRPPTPRSCWPGWPPPDRTRSSSTCGCRRRTLPRASTPPRRSRPTTPRSGSSFSRPTLQEGAARRLFEQHRRHRLPAQGQCRRRRGAGRGRAHGGQRRLGDRAGRRRPPGMLSRVGRPARRARGDGPRRWGRGRASGRSPGRGSRRCAG